MVYSSQLVTQYNGTKTSLMCVLLQSELFLELISFVAVALERKFSNKHK